MSRFVKALEKATGKKVIITTMSVTHDEREDVGILYRLAAIFKRSLRDGIKYKKASGKKLRHVSTSDLDVNGKLRPDYLSRRDKSRKKRDRPKSFGSVD